MSKKFLKGFLIFSIILFSIGMFSVFGLNSFKNESVVQTNVESKSDNNVDLSLNRNLNGDVVSNIVRQTDALAEVTGNSNGTIQQRFASADYTVKLITTASDLAELAYNVNNGTETDSKTIYFLTENIDLSTDSIHYWTPIGSYAYPFKGIFYGNGKTISNVFINDLSISRTSTASGSGLFGNNTGVISELTVSNVVDTTTSGSVSAKGTLVGVNSGYVVDCTGTIGSGSAVITSKKINANGGNFKRGNNPWYKDTQLNVTTDSTLNSKFDYYQLYSNIVLRENANAENVYPIKQGFKATNIPQNGGNITWTETSVSVVFDYNYGERKNIQVTTFGYDQTFKSWFTQNPSYKTRVGYTFASLKVSSQDNTTYDTNGDLFNQSYPVYTTSGSSITSTAFFNWTWDNVDTTFNITSQVAKTDSFMANTGFSFSGLTYIDGNGNATTNYTPQKRFIVSLNDGYEILTNSYTGNGQAADNPSGVYVNFTNLTGEDPGYNANADNDSYNPVEASITRNGNTYSITVSNLVGGSAGCVYLSIQRSDINVKLVPIFTQDMEENKYQKSISFNDENKTIEVRYTKNNEAVVSFGMVWSLEEGSGYNRLAVKNNEAYLIVKKGDNAYLKFSPLTGGEVEGLYIFRFDGDYNDTENHVSVLDSTDNVTTYSKTHNLTVLAGDNASTSLITTITYYIGQLMTNVQAKFYNGTQQIDFVNSLYTGINISINGGDALNNASQLINLRQGGEIVSSPDEFKVRANGYYKVGSIEIFKGDSTSDDKKIATITNFEFQNEVSTSQLDGNVFADAFEGLGINYTVKVNLTQRTYDVNVGCYYTYTDNQTTTTVDISSLFIALPSYSSQSPNTEITLTITMNDTAKQILKYGSFGVENSQGDAPGGYLYHSFCVNEIDNVQDNFNDGECKFDLRLGTYNADIKIYFVFKEITIKVAPDTSGDNVAKWINTTGTPAKQIQAKYKFSYSNGNVRLSLPLESLNSLDVRADLYLKGWIFGGTEYTGDFAFHNNEGVLGYLKNVGGEHINQDFEVTATPSTANRTLRVSYYSGVYENEIYSGGEWSSQVTVYKGTVTSIDNTISDLAVNNTQFKRLANTQSGWSVESGKGFVNGSQYAINAISDWYKTFNNSTEDKNYQSWNQLKTADERDVNLTAVWTRLNYTVTVDEGQSCTISLYDSVAFVPSGNKDGLATYTFTNRQSSGAESTSSISSGRAGFIAQSFKIKHSGTFDNKQNFIFDVASMKTLLNSANYFAENSSANPIEITTNRSAATYTVTAKGSAYYAVNGISNRNVQLSDEATYGQTYHIDTTIFVRAGYRCVGFKRYLGGTTTEDFINDAIYNIADDIIIIPVWERVGVLPTSLSITGLTDLQNFYAYTSHDLYRGGITSNCTNLSELAVGNILDNGEVVKDIGFKLYRNSTNYLVSKPDKIFNVQDFAINNTVLTGQYTIYFYIEVYENNENSLIFSNGTCYTTNTVDSMNLTLNKNEIVFTGDFYTTYNGTDQFVANELNDYGTFYFKYDWNGVNINPEQIDIDSISDFDNFRLLKVVAKEGLYNAGSGYDLKAYITNDIFASINPNYGTNYDGIFSNVSSDANGYYASILGQTTVDKAKINLTSVAGQARLPNGSAYYIEDVEIVAYLNVNGNSFNFAVGDQTYTFTYDKITLLENISGHTYQGANDYSIDSEVFKVYGLKIKKLSDSTYTDFETVQNNFEWTIPEDFTFVLINSDNAIKLIYQTKYLTASNGMLNSTLANSFDGVSEKLQITSIVAGGQTITNTNKQYSYFVDNQILFSFVENQSSKIIIYVNDQALTGLANGMKINIGVMDPIRSELKILKWGDTTNSSAYINDLDDFSASLNKEFTVSSQSQVIYAVMTDVVKLNVDYNDGHNTLNSDNETLYLSTTGFVTLANPVHDYQGLNFACYTELSTNTNINKVVNEGNCQFKSVRAGDSETIYAKWTLDHIVAEQVSNSFTVYAGPTGNEIAVDEIVNITPLNSSTLDINFNYSLSGKGYNFDFDQGAFKIKNSQGIAPTSLSTVGNEKYILTVTLSVNDHKQPTQTKTVQFEFDYTININQVGLIGLTNSLTFNNQNRISDVYVKTILNNEESESTALSLLPTRDGFTEGYGYYITILSQNKNLSEINLVDTYVITAHIDSSLTEVYEFKPNTSTLSVTVNKFTIVLENYQDQVNLSKYFRDTEPDLKSDIIIEANNNDEVNITFAREAGENMDFYRLSYVSITSQDDRDNYDVDDTNFEAYFEIKVPEKRILIRMHDTLHYIYNGYKLENLVITKIGSIYTLSGMAGSLNVSTTIDLYYVSADDGIIDSDLINFVLFNIDNEKNVGQYHVGVELNTAVTGADYWEKGVEIINQENAKIIVSKRDVSINAITKTFDRTNEINQNTSIQFVNAVSQDDLTVSGTFATVLAGTNIEFINLALAGADAQNYNLLNDDFANGIINPKSVSQVRVQSRQNSIQYGRISRNTTINEIFNIAYCVISLDGETTDLSNGFITLVNWSVTGDPFSSTDYLTAGQKELTIIFTTTNFSGINSSGYQLVLNIAQKQLDLSWIDVVKNYDETTALPKVIVTDISSMIINGDDVTINKAASGYQTSDVGQRIPVNFILQGVDKDNYQVIDNVYGKINKFAVTFRVNATTENEDLVTYGSFVDDLQEVVVLRQLLTVDYPSNATGQQILSSFIYPTRVGYTATGWKYLDGGNYVLITAQNVKSLISSVAIDEENVDSILTIYTVWEINNYQLNVNGQHLSSYQISGEKVTGNSTDGYFAEYYSDVAITVVGDKGFKVNGYTAQQGTYKTINPSDTGNNTGSVEIEKVFNDLNIEVHFVDIKININYDINMPAYTSRVDRNPLKAEHTYTQLTTMTKGSLPQFMVTAGTYKLDDFVYGVGDTSITNKTLSQVVDELIPTLETDSEIALKLTWVGENYLAIFDAQGGELDGSEQLNIVYGQQLLGLPTALKPGKTATWTCPDNETYEENDIFHSVGNYNNQQWTITFTAVYTNNTYTLTVNLGNYNHPEDHEQEFIVARVNGILINNGQTFDIVYEEGQLEIVVSPDSGYNFEIDRNAFVGDVENEGNVITIRNLLENCEITINPIPVANILTLINANFNTIVVRIDGEEVVPTQITGAYQISAFTESEVEISLTAKKGTAFAENLVILSGSGSLTKTLSSFNKKLDLTWTGFTDRATITIDVELSDNVVSFVDLSEYFDYISINDASLSITGGNLYVKTNQVANIKATLKYGYKDAVIALSNNIAQVQDETNTFSEIDRKYHFACKIINIDEDVEFSFTCDKREYTFVISVNENQSEVGEITCQATQTVLFGEDITLSQNLLHDRYVFSGWTMNGDIISNEETDVITIDASLSTLLERNPLGENIIIIANYKEKIASIKFTSGTKGSFEATQDENSFEVEAQQTVIQKIRIGANITFVLRPDEGYEFDKLLANDTELSDTDYNFNDQIITYFLSVDTEVESFTILFKASDAYVYIDAAVMLNFELTRYTTQGGKVFIADRNGVKASEESYLAVDDDLEIGGKYKILTKTDATIYLIAEAKVGFEAYFSNPTSDCIINEFKVDGVTIYSFTGVKNGTIAEAIFTAKQNKFNIVLVDETMEVVPAGKVSVDTTSALVRASGNNSANVMAYAVTGQGLDIEISTGFNHRFDLDDFGNLKYTLDKEETEGTVILLDQIIDVDPLITGTTSKIVLQVENVDTDATLYVFVKAEKYNLRFFIDENTIVTVNEILQYGKNFSLNELTLEQKQKILAKRENYTLDGYYTKQLGQGNKYVDGQAKPYSTWYESGYVFNGSRYEYASNYDEQTKTFTVYPYWVYNKANIWVDTIPEDILRQNGNISIRNVIVNYDDQTSWISQNDLWFAQVRVGNQLQLRAYNLTNYEFKYWLISVDGGAPIQREREFTITLEQSDYVLVAVYQPLYNIVVEDIDGRSTEVGSAYLLQDNIVLSGNSYDSSKIVEIEALPEAGYKLLYFVNVDSGEIYTGQFNSNTGATRYTFPSLINAPLNLKAIFEGKEVLVNIDYQSLENYHQISKVLLNDQEVNYRTTINAKVGDKLEIEIMKSFGYKFKAQGATFEVTNTQNKYNLTTYLKVEELETAQNNKFRLNVSFKIDREEVSLKINAHVNDSTGKNEDIISSKIQIVYSDGKKIDLNDGVTFKVLYGETAYLYILPSKNYKLEQIYIQDEYIYSILSAYDGEKIEINNSFLDLNINEILGYQINILVTFDRLVWIMEEYRSQSLAGEGTEENPFVIRSEAEMAYVAYVVNTGLETEYGVKYADCHYRLISDLDFDGKYFEPIGTKDNPFNGVLDLGNYNIKNVVHYKLYTEPKTRAKGLVWCLGENGKIIQSNSVLIITLSVFGSVVVASGVTLLAVLLSRRKKRKMNATL